MGIGYYDDNIDNGDNMYTKLLPLYNGQKSS